MKLLHKNINLIAAIVFFVAAISIPTESYAAISNTGLLDKVIERFQSKSTGWANAITTAASWLFWTLATISFAWTFGIMILKKSDIQEFFAEFVKFTLFIGFFFWLLIKAPEYSKNIIDSLKSLASTASGFTEALTPSGIVDIGFAIFNKTISVSSFWDPIDSAVAILIALAILTVLALIAINMLLLLITGWILSYAGIFYLGFGGSRWTSDIAINYYKTVLGIAIQLFTMVLIVGIGKTFIDDLYKEMTTKDMPYGELGVMLVASVSILVLSNKVPSMLAGVIAGASTGNSGIGQFGAGAAVGAIAGAAAGAATAVGAVKAAATMAGGSIKAGQAAFSVGKERASQARSMSQGMSSSNSNSNTSTSSPFSQAAGMESPSAASSTSKTASSGQSSNSQGQGSNSTPSFEGGSQSSMQSTSAGSASETSSEANTSPFTAQSGLDNASTLNTSENAKNLNNAAATSEKSDTGQAKSKAESAPAPKPPGLLAKSTTAQTAGALAKGAWNTFTASANNAFDGTVGGKIAKTIIQGQQTTNGSTSSPASFQKGNSISNPTAMDELKDFINKKP